MSKQIDASQWLDKKGFVCNNPRGREFKIPLDWTGETATGFICKYVNPAYPEIYIRRIENPNYQQWYGVRYSYGVWINGGEQVDIAHPKGCGLGSVVIVTLAHLKKTLKLVHEELGTFLPDIPESEW